MFIAALFTVTKSWKQSRYSSTDEYKQNVLCTYNWILLSHEREWNSDTGYNRDEPWKYDAKGLKPDTKGQTYDSTFIRKTK